MKQDHIVTVAFVVEAHSPDHAKHIVEERCRLNWPPVKQIGFTTPTVVIKSTPATQLAGAADR